MHRYKLTGETGSYRYMAPEVFRHEPYNTKVWQVHCGPMSYGVLAVEDANMWGAICNALAARAVYSVHLFAANCSAEYEA